MKSKVLNYRIIIDADKRLGTDEAGYSVYCPTLDVASEGETVEEAIKNVGEAIECRLEALAKDKAPIPSPDDPATTIVTYSQSELPKGYKANFA